MIRYLKLWVAGSYGNIKQTLTDHIHLKYLGDNDELHFRDFLNDNPAIAKHYEELKLSL